MPDSLEAALVFSIVIVPGYLLLRGYYVGRAHTVPERDLYVLAQSVVASLVWLAVTWLVVDDLLRWIDRDELGGHELEAYGIGALIIAAPYVAGRLTGAFVTWTHEGTGQLRHALGWLLRIVVATVEHPTAWEYAWAGRNKAYVKVVLDDKRTVFGQFANSSRVDVAPKPRQLFREQTYEVNSAGMVIGTAGSIHIDGARIVSVEFV